MQCAPILLEKLLSNEITEDNLKIVEKHASFKGIKPNVTSYLISNKTNILKNLSLAKSIDLQILILKIISKCINKKQIQTEKYFGNTTNQYLSYKKLEKKDLRLFLIYFNNHFETEIENSNKILGCRIKSLKSSIKSLSLQEGEIFLNENHIKVYGNDNIVVVYYKSIKRINVTNLNIKISSFDDKLVEIEFINDFGFDKIKERLIEMFSLQMITDESMSLEINEENKELISEERVTFKLNENKKIISGSNEDNIESEICEDFKNIFIEKDIHILPDGMNIHNKAQDLIKNIPSKNSQENLKSPVEIENLEKKSSSETNCHEIKKSCEFEYKIEEPGEHCFSLNDNDNKINLQNDFKTHRNSKMNKLENYNIPKKFKRYNKKLKNLSSRKQKKMRNFQILKVIKH